MNINKQTSFVCNFWQKEAYITELALQCHSIDSMHPYMASDSQQNLQKHGEARILHTMPQQKVTNDDFSTRSAS